MVAPPLLRLDHGCLGVVELEVELVGLARARQVRFKSTYTDVCINTDPAAPILATARDERNRLQYRYTADHHQRRAEEKFARLLLICEVVPRILRQLDTRRVDGLANTRDESVRFAILLLAECGFRVGSPEYLKSNESHGLTNLLVRHYDPATQTLAFGGKKGVHNRCTVGHGGLAAFLTQKTAAADSPHAEAPTPPAVYPSGQSRH